MTSVGRKNKRGDRGSLDEDASVAKKSNMAESCEEGAANTSDQTEPSLADIREMPVDIQITVSKILLENQHFKQELLELKSSPNANRR